MSWPVMTAYGGLSCPQADSAPNIQVTYPPRRVLQDLVLADAFRAGVHGVS